MSIAIFIGQFCFVSFVLCPISRASHKALQKKQSSAAARWHLVLVHTTSVAMCKGCHNICGSAPTFALTGFRGPIGWMASFCVGRGRPGSFFYAWRFPAQIHTKQYSTCEVHQCIFTKGRPIFCLRCCCTSRGNQRLRLNLGCKYGFHSEA